MCVRIFLHSLEHEFAACILKAKKARSRGVSFHLCSPRSQSRNPYFDGIDPCLTDRGDQRHLRKCKLVKSWLNTHRVPNKQCAMETTSIAVSTTIFLPRHAILTRAVVPRMDQEIKVLSFVPILRTVVFKLQLK